MTESSFILVPGAGGMAWYWHRIVPLLEQAGCEAIAVDLPADDRFFPLEFQKRVARERLKAEAEVIPGGHLVALSQPEELAARLLRFGRGVFR